MIALYARVSTVEQNTDMQVRELIAACGDSPRELYEDHFTGTSDDRVSLQRMLADARLGKFTRVIIFKTDRLSRNVRDFLNIQHELDSLGIDIVSLHDPMDVSTPSGRAMLHIMAAMGQLEVENIRLRVKSGMAAARARGVKFGPPKRELDVARLEALYAADVHLVDIARELGFSISHLYRLIGCKYGSLQAFRARFLCA